MSDDKTIAEAKKETAAANSGENAAELKEPDYVTVTDSANGEPLELPTGDDNLLGLSTLKHAFPGAHGLKYKNPATGASRVLMIDSTGTKFHPPKGGWADRLFTVIYPSEPTAKRSLSGDPNPKRKKMMDEAIASDSDGEGNGTHFGGPKLQRLNEQEDPKAPLSKQTSGKAERSEAPSVERKASDKSERSECVDLIVLGLPYSLREEEMRAYFSEFGPVQLCEIKKTPGGDSRGFGFVRMERLDDQTAVLKAAHTIGGRKCQVKMPLPKDDRDGRQENVRLFVGRLSEKITTKRLREFFQAEARQIDPRVQIVDVFIPTPFRGFAFVTLSSTSAAKELLKKDNFTIDDVPLSLSIAAPKQQPPPFGQPAAPYGRRDFYENPRLSLPDPWERRPHVPMGPRFSDAYDQRRYETASPVPSGSNALVNNLETLNLNNLNMPPEVLNSAWQAFYSVALGPSTTASGPVIHRGHPNDRPMPQRGPPPFQPPAPQSAHRQRGHQPMSSPPWR